jgi:flagellar assembly protein FliH
MRGDAIPIEPVAWRRVSSLGLLGGEILSDNLGESGPQEGGEEDGAEAAADVDALVAAARQQGFEEGHTAASQNLGRELQAVQAKLARSIEELTGLRPRYRRQAEQDVVALALGVARRILHRELTVSPEALHGLVKAALDKLDAREVHQARVSGADAAMLRQFFEQMGTPYKVEILADPSLAPGSVLIESSHGTLDASVDTQLAEIDRGLADLVRGAA